MQRSISCCIAIFPPRPILAKSVEASKELHRLGSVFTLDSRRYYPHLTLYMTEFPKKNLRQIKQLLHRIASQTRPFLLRPATQRSHRGYVDISFQRSRAVLQLHKTVVRTLNPLREWLIRPKDKRRFKELTLSERRSLKCYGYNRALFGFIPHLTLTKLRKESKGIRQRFDLPAFSFNAGRMALFRSAARGTCRELISQFKLRE